MAHKVQRGSFADKARGTRHERGYGSAWDIQRQRIKQRANGLCEPCLAVGLVHQGHQCDHVISKAEWKQRFGARPGVDDDTNLQWMHRDCHAAKTIIDRQRAAGAPVPPWAPTTPTPLAAAVGKPSGLGAPTHGAPSTGGQQAGGGEKSAAPRLGTGPLGKFSRAGNPGGGGTPAAGGGAI